jgi:ankyrin repeat protein
MELELQDLTIEDKRQTEGVLHKACKEGDYKSLVEYFESHPEIQESEVNMEGAGGRTALHRATQSGSVECVRYLIAKKANVNAIDKQGRTPLHWACIGGDKQTVAELLKSTEINVNAISQSGATPLHSAASIFNIEIMQLLIKRGANPDIQDNDGLIASELLEKMDSSSKNSGRRQTFSFGGLISKTKSVMRSSSKDVNSRKKVNAPLDKYTATIIPFRSLERSNTAEFYRNVEITVSEAKGFTKDLRNAYCSIRQDSKCFQTQKKDRTKAPFWGDTFR